MKILKLRNDYSIINENIADITKELAPGFYTVRLDKFLQVYLEKREGLILPEKIYKFDDTLVEFISVDFETSEENVGVCLKGEKGLGKSVTAKRIALKMAETMPVILIEKSINVESDLVNFLTKLQNIQSYALFIDEFDKTFPDYAVSDEDTKVILQKDLLPFLDGLSTGKNKVLFMITCNKDINTYYRNRPSRIKWMKEYMFMNRDLINEIIDDLLEDNKFKEDLIDHIDYDSINVDGLIKIIESINKFEIPYSQFKDLFNVRSLLYRYTLKIDGKLEKLISNDERFNFSKVKYIADYTVKQVIFSTPSSITFKSRITNYKEGKVWENKEVTITIEEVSDKQYRVYASDLALKDSEGKPLEEHIYD